MATSQTYIEMEDKYAAHNYHPLPVVINKADGIWVWDVEGKKYMDTLSSYSALNQGHCHPKIMNALKSQAERVTLTSRAFYNDQLGPLVKKLCEISSLETVLLMNSGAEAVETAIKMVRKWGYKKKGIPEGKAEIITCEQNFHGRTVTIVGFSTDEQYKQGFGPFTPGFVSIPYGDTNALEKAITPNTAAFILEPIQGEGGIIIPPEGFLKKAYDICKKNNVLFIADEIQTGLGRTGKLFACDYERVTPDGYIVGKALSGGAYPVSAVISKWDYMDVFTPGDHGSTFGGNPLGCAVANAAITALLEEKMVENSYNMGEYFMDKLRELNSPHVKEIRGKGLMIGVEIKKESGTARPFCEKLMEKGILAKETHHQVIRFAPPLVIKKEDIDWALEHIREVLK